MKLVNFTRTVQTTFLSLLPKCSTFKLYCTGNKSKSSHAESCAHPGPQKFAGSICVLFDNFIVGRTCVAHAMPCLETSRCLTFMIAAKMLLWNLPANFFELLSEHYVELDSWARLRGCCSCGNVWVSEPKDPLCGFLRIFSFLSWRSHDSVQAGFLCA
jgi:hypothetical protein